MLRSWGRGVRALAGSKAFSGHGGLESPQVLRAITLINVKVFNAGATNSSSPRTRAIRELRGGGIGCPQSRGGPFHHPAAPPPRSQRRLRCDARGGEVAARAFAWAEGKAASPVCFIFSWQLGAAQLRSAGGAGRAAGEGGPSRQGGRADGAPAERGYRRRAAERRRPRPPPRRLRGRQK